MATSPRQAVGSNWRQRLAQLTLSTLVSAFRSLAGKEKALPHQPTLNDLPPAFLAAARLTQNAA